MITLVYYETLPQKYFYKSCRKGLKTLLYFSILITWLSYSCNGHNGTANFDAATTVSYKDQQKNTSMQVDCTVDVQGIVVSHHKTSNTAQSISNGIWSKFKQQTSNLQN